jgi:hypothetical protein
MSRVLFFNPSIKKEGYSSRGMTESGYPLFLFERINV